jgi:hypothetical protein
MLVGIRASIPLRPSVEGLALTAIIWGVVVGRRLRLA